MIDKGLFTKYVRVFCSSFNNCSPVLFWHGSAKAPQKRIVMPKRNSIADVTYGHVGTRKYEN